MHCAHLSVYKRFASSQSSCHPKFSLSTTNHLIVNRPRIYNSKLAESHLCKSANFLWQMRHHVCIWRKQSWWSKYLWRLLSNPWITGWCAWWKSARRPLLQTIMMGINVGENDPYPSLYWRHSSMGSTKFQIIEKYLGWQFSDLKTSWILSRQFQARICLLFTL